MTVADTIREGVIAWVRQAASLSGTDVVAREGVSGQQERPALPYLTIRLIAQDVPRQSVGEVRYRDDDTRVITTERAARLSMQAFGDAAAVWMEAATLLLDDADIIELLWSSGLTVEPVGGMTDLTTVVDSGHEPRYVREYEIRYTLTSDAAAYPVAGTVVIDPITLVRYDGAPDALTTSITVSL